MARKSADSELARAGRVGCEGAGWSSETRRNQGAERGNRMIFIADPQPIAQIVPERQAKLLAGLRKDQHAVARLAAVATDRASGNLPIEIGRASCRERVCQYVLIRVVGVSSKKKTNK